MNILKVILPPRVSDGTRVLLHSEDNAVIHIAIVSGPLLTRMAGRRWAFFRCKEVGGAVELGEEVVPRTPW